MTALWIVVGLACAAVAAIALAAAARRLRGRDAAIGRAVIVDPDDTPGLDRDSRAVRSVQAADLFLPEDLRREIWSPVYLERLARTYWRFLARATVGLVRVRYTDRERFVIAVASPLKLLTFRAPEYEMDERHGLVRWRIERGLLVAREGHRGGGYLQIEVHRRPSEDPREAHLHIEVEVANFYPSIAAGIGRWFYNETQSRIHVIVTHGFLRSLARLDLAQSRVKRFTDDDTLSSLAVETIAGLRPPAGDRDRQRVPEG